MQYVIVSYILISDNYNLKYFQLFIDNEWVDAKNGKTFKTYCPHDGSVIANVAEGDKVCVTYRHCYTYYRVISTTPR